jgi:hypothetical protein
MIAREQRDFRMAEEWYHKSLVIKERLGDDHGAGITYHQLGLIALTWIIHDFAGGKRKGALKD